MSLKKTAKQLLAEANAAIRTITAAEAIALQGSAQFVDIREPAEVAAGTVPGAVAVPRGLLEFAADPDSPAHKPQFSAGKPLVLFCASGGRSALATKTLTDMGFTDLCHIAGGFTAWKAAGGKVGEPG
jgi:rhodanese-related sulfurtransferase